MQRVSYYSIISNNGHIRALGSGLFNVSLKALRHAIQRHYGQLVLINPALVYPSDRPTPGYGRCHITVLLAKWAIMAGNTAKRTLEQG